MASNQYIFRSPDYRGPSSYEEGKALVLKNRGKAFDEIPLKELISYALVNINYHTGVATAIEWGGMFTKVQDPDTGSIHMKLLGEGINHTPVHIGFYYPHQNTPDYLQREVKLKQARVLQVGILADAQVFIRESPSRKNLIRERRRSTSMEPSQVLRHILLSNIFIDISTLSNPLIIKDTKETDE